MQDIISILSKEFSKKPNHIQAVISLIDEGNTIPFIARYRKEMHGSMDDTALRDIADRLNYLRNLQKRRDEVSSSIEEQGKLTEELVAAINSAATLAELEDIYRPYKQKRRTRATVAREKGLAPLAELLFSQTLKSGSLCDYAEEYIDEEKAVLSAEEALAGAADIIAEEISDNASLRKTLKELLFKKGELCSRAAGEEDSVYRLYYDYSEPISKIPSHRLLAINRGENTGFLKVSVRLDEETALKAVYDESLIEGSISTEFVRAAAEDSYKRLIFPSVERELRSMLTETASEQAIRNFKINLKALLLSPPIKNKVTMGFDPGNRTGCKIAVVDGTGKVLDTSVVYPTPPHNKTAQAAATLGALIKKHGIELIAIGNGTASKESEIFIAGMLKDYPKVSYVMVNEAGASVYSASKLAAAEFPDYDVSLRSAVSIARRLQDSLAELVKIEPKSIGVGLYQHDMPAARLDEALGGVVEDCVNSVGADINTASPSLLSYVSGLNSATAKNIVAYREENGIFTSRRQLLKVPKLGQKTFLQCAGFLRVPESKNILDNTAVHPESYELASLILKTLEVSLEDIAAGRTGGLKQKAEKFGEQRLAAVCEAGLPTVHDIISELQKPGRDPRDELPRPQLRTDVMDIKDIKPGMVFTGTVRNVIDFGAFVDIGVHQDGLVHISEISSRYIKHPSDALTVGQSVKCLVLSVDVPKKRIGLSIKQVEDK